MRRRQAAAAGSLALLIVWLSGCFLPNNRPAPGPLSTADVVNTAAAQTVSALGTRIAAGENPTLGAATLVIPTVAPASTEETPVPLATTAVSPPQATGEAGATGTPASDAPCNQASFVSDATIPDDAILPANTVFTKTWELKNTGSCAWDSSYAVVFAGRGNALSGPPATPLVASGEIKPGETARVSVVMRAPDAEGEYMGYWMLRSGDNKTFGTGPKGSAPFFVKIRVEQSYSFAEHWCSARWVSGAGDLPCPGEERDPRGYALLLTDPTLEDNEEREGLGVLSAAQPVAGGFIAAHFPAVIVPDEADFRATIGCQPGATGCYVRFKVTARIDGGEERVLGEWNEGYEGGLSQAIIDLDDLAGRSVAFSLYVTALGAPDHARGIWFHPRIVK